jgi:hypothetical protein
MLPRVILAIILLSTIAPIAGATAASPSESVIPDVAVDPPIQLWLSGPFGRVEGSAVFEPATAAPASDPLDTYVKRAPMVLDAGDAPLPTRSLTVISTSIASGETERLSTGALAFEGPGEPGGAIIIASLQTPGGRSTRRAWLVDVPDREPPADGLYDIPAPEVIVASGATSAAGSPGNGCYLYLCVEIGRMPPAAALPSLDAEPAETLSATLSDGSAIVAWDGVLRRIGDAGGPRQAASGVVTGEPEAVVNLTGLEVPGEGDWMLTLRVVFDRDRGWMESRYRVRAQ